MADIKSINGNPIVVGTSGIEDGAVTAAKLAEGIVEAETLTHDGVLLGYVSESRFVISGEGFVGTLMYDMEGHGRTVHITKTVGNRFVVASTEEYPVSSSLTVNYVNFGNNATEGDYVVPDECRYLLVYGYANSTATIDSLAANTTVIAHSVVDSVARSALSDVSTSIDNVSGFEQINYQKTTAHGWPQSGERETIFVRTQVGGTAFIHIINDSDSLVIKKTSGNRFTVSILDASAMPGDNQAALHDQVSYATDATEVVYTHHVDAGSYIAVYCFNNSVAEEPYNIEEVAAGITVEALTAIDINARAELSEKMPGTIETSSVDGITWQIAGLGSGGETYTPRKTDVCSSYIDGSTVKRVKVPSGLTMDVCVYQSEGASAVRRYRPAGSNVNVSALLAENGCSIFRVAIYDATEPVVQTDLSYAETVTYGVDASTVLSDYISGHPEDNAIVKLHKDEYQDAMVMRLRKLAAEQPQPCDLKMMWISDIHAESEKASRMVQLVNAWGSNVVDFVLNTGDTVLTLQGQGLDWYYPIVANLNVPYLNVVGNHDAWSSLGVLGSAATTYSLVIAPMIGQSGAVQPTDAAANSLNYYYRDFGDIRIIALDCMFWDATQLAWLVSALDDAKTNGKSVICTAHAPFAAVECRMLETQWNYSSFIRDTTKTSIEAAQAVQDFRDAGGKFIAWMTGHLHTDEVSILPNYGNQLLLINGSPSNRTTMPKSTDPESPYYDLLTYVAIDTYNKLIKLRRVGACISADGRKHHGLSVNYETNEIVADW